jgi:hypothetical protein
MPGSLHLFFTRELPDLEDEQAPELLLVEEHGGEFTEGEAIAPEQLEYVSTLVSNYDDLERLNAAVNEWWLAWAGVAPQLELIADAPERMAEDPRTRLGRLERANSWSINTVFVAYRRDSSAARAEAVRFLVETCTARWN